MMVRVVIRPAPFASATTVVVGHFSQSVLIIFGLLNFKLILILSRFLNSMRVINLKFGFVKRFCS